MSICVTKKLTLELMQNTTFFATSHGKGPCDGLGGTVKRLAAKASLQQRYNEEIMTPQQLFDFVRENISSINTVYCSMDDFIILLQS